MRRVSLASFHAGLKASPDASLDTLVVTKSADGAVDSTPSAGRTKRFTISTEAVDRSGDIIKVAGWVLDDYEKNPVVLFDHDPASPIASAVATYPANGSLKSIALFPDAGINPLSDSVFGLINAGILRASSVGFKPLEWQPDDTRPGIFGGPGINFSKTLLLEWSVVSVPDNPEALLEAKSVDLRPYSMFLEKRLDEGTLNVTKDLVTKAYKIANAKNVTISIPKQENTMPLKSGKVMSSANLQHLKDAMDSHAEAVKCHKAMLKCHKDAMAHHDDAMAHHDKCMKHIKALLDKAAGNESGEEEQEEENANPSSTDPDDKKAGNGHQAPDADADDHDNESDDDDEDDKDKSFSADALSLAFSQAFEVKKTSIDEGITLEQLKDILGTVVNEEVNEALRKARGKGPV